MSIAVISSRNCRLKWPALATADNSVTLTAWEIFPMTHPKSLSGRIACERASNTLLNTPGVSARLLSEISQTTRPSTMFLPFKGRHKSKDQCRGDRSLDSARDSELVEVLVAQHGAGGQKAPNQGPCSPLYLITTKTHRGDYQDDCPKTTTSSSA